MNRDPDLIRKSLYIQDNKIFTKENCIIQIPARYENQGLFEISTDTSFVAIYALIMGDNYCISCVPSMVHSKPLKMEEVSVNGVEYFNLMYGKDSCIIESTSVQRKDTVTYFLFDEFNMHGRIPWFLDYDDVGTMFDESDKYADTNIGKNRRTMELLTSFISREEDDHSVFYRQGDLRTKPAYVGIDSVLYSARSTLTKLAGNYFKEGLVSALVTKTEETSKMERILTA